MGKLLLIAASACVAITVSSCVSGSSSAENDGFVSIYNGTDSTGWQGAVKYYDFTGSFIECHAKHGGVIYTDKQYTNFVVRFEFRLPPGGNNGLAIRYPGQGDTAYVGMCELQILDNTAKCFDGKLDERQYHGSIYGMVAAKRGFLKPVGEWNQQTVTVDGSTIKVELNGEVIVDGDVAEVTEFMGGKPHPGKDRTEGYFGFAGHGSPVAFRNIFIKEL